MLERAVVLLGAALSLATLWAAGPGLLVGIAAVVAFAIAATVPVIGADGEDVTASIAFTAVLGVLMVLALPLLVPLLGLSPVAQRVEDHGARIMARGTDRSQPSDPPQGAPTPVRRRRKLPRGMRPPRNTAPHTRSWSITIACVVQVYQRNAHFPWNSLAHNPLVARCRTGSNKD